MNERRIIWIDQQPLRDGAREACLAVLSRLEKAREDWARYENADRPAFERWKASTFGALLSHLRETEASIGELERLIDEVNTEMTFGTARTERAAYQRVLHRRAHPDRYSEAADREPESAEPDEFEKEMMFEETLRMFTHIDPDRIDDAAYESMFDEFKRNVFGRRNATTEDKAGAIHEFPDRDRPTVSSRVKELYRTLVRRLHPDLRPDGKAEVSALWHDVQEAYESGNVERLETLLALTDMHANTLGEHTSLAQLRAIAAELADALHTLRRCLRMAKSDQAWNFSEAPAARLTALRQKLEAGIKAELQDRLGYLAELNATVTRWKSRAHPRPAKAQADSAFRFST